MRHIRRTIVGPALAWLVVAVAAPVRAEVGVQGATKPSLVVVDNGVDASKRPVYTITAKSTEITEVLRAVFAKAAVEYAIDQDVVGPVDVNLKNRTFDEILMQIRDTARPPIKILRGEDKVYRVSRDYVLEEKAAILQNRLNNQGGGFGSGQIAPSGPRVGQFPGSQVMLPADKFVSLNVPDSSPIPLSQALARISAQTGFPILLDKRVPQEVKFSGSIEASLNLALPALADIAGLRLVMSGGQAVFVPTDSFRILVNNMLLGQTGSPCTKCRQTVWSTWSFCPNCGQITPRGAQTQMQNSYMNRQQQRPGTNNPVRKIDR
jgi:hypothetical protein